MKTIQRNASKTTTYNDGILKKCSSNPQEGKKRMRSRGKKQKTSNKMVDCNANISIMILNLNHLTSPIKKIEIDKVDKQTI